MNSERVAAVFQFARAFVAGSGVALLLGLFGAPVFAEPLPLGRDVPPPEECTVAPRSVDQLLEFAEAADGPGPRNFEETARPRIAAGVVPPKDIAEVQAAIRGIVACTNVGDQTRIFAWYSDDILTKRISLDRETLETPTPLPDGERMAILGVPYVVPLDDGRIGAVVVFDHPASPSPVQAFFWIFAKQDGRWLFDAWPDPYITTFESSVDIID